MRKKIIMVLAVFLMSAASKAQNEPYKKHNDSAEIESMNEVLVSAQRFGSSRGKTTRQIEIVDARQMQLAQQGNMADVLSQTGQVFVQKSQLGGGSPVIRGFEASRVLLVVDGVRMNNATYRAGHLQDIIAVDQFMLDRTEVFFGSGSTQYGSDALGGVVYLKTKDPKFRNAPFGFAGANANFRYLSAANAVVSNANLELSGKKVSWIFSSTSSDFGDLRMGQRRNFSQWDTFGQRRYYAGRSNNRDTILTNSDPFVQLGTAYRQYDVFSKLALKTGGFTHILNAQISRAADIPRYDRLTDVSAGLFRFATWNYIPQNRSFLSYTLLLPKKSKMEQRLILSTQGTEVGRVTRRFNNQNELTQLDKVRMLALNYDLQYNITKVLQIQGGVEVVGNRVNSAASNRNVITNEVTASKNTRYADAGATTFSAAAFANAIWEIKPDDFILEGGIRLTHYRLTANFSEDNFLKLPYTVAENRSVAPVYNIGFTKKMDIEGLFVKGSLASGFRNPNVDDMTKLFESQPGRKIVVPNRELSPERTRTLDLGIRYDSRKVHFEFGGYYTKILNLLIDRRSSINGSDSLLFDGIMTPVFQMDNTAGGYITGSYLAAKLKLYKNLFADVNYTSTFGRFRQSENTAWTPIDHIAPDHGRVGLRWASENWQWEAFMLFNGRKVRREYSPSGEDNAQYAPGGQTPSWQTYNIRASWNINTWFIASFAVENILDLNYRVFSSGMSAPGRNLAVSAKFSF
jgi:hemoglobin/transferrin/lactoferrin receptor protein